MEEYEGNFDSEETIDKDNEKLDDIDPMMVPISQMRMKN